MHLEINKHGKIFLALLGDSAASTFQVKGSINSKHCKKATTPAV